MVVIEDYNPDWPNQYEQERNAIVAAIGPWIADIQHAGSTSVPGLAAKPVIDICIDLNTYPLPAEAIEAMQALGYEYRGEYGIAGREYFNKKSPRRYHVHAYSPGNPEWDAHILFRDYLRAMPDAAMQYELLKRDLAQRSADAYVYTDDKTDFVLGTLEQARKWRTQAESAG